MSNYYGNSGPSFLLIRDDGSKYQKYDFSAPQIWSEDPWKLLQTQKRDVNNIIRADVLKYQFEQYMEWRPTEATGNTYIQNLITIANWYPGGSSHRRIVFYPHSDTLLVYFDIIIVNATPFLFTKVPYNGFKMGVLSKDLYPRIASPDALAAIDFGQQDIEVTNEDSSSA